MLTGLLQITASMTGLFIASRPLAVWLGSLFNIPGPHPYYAGIPLALLVMDFVIGLGFVVTTLALAGRRCYRMLAGLALASCILHLISEWMYFSWAGSSRFLAEIPVEMVYHAWLVSSAVVLIMALVFLINYGEVSVAVRPH